MLKLLDALIFLGITYPYGVLSGIIFWVLSFLNLIKVRHFERFPRRQGKIILVSNHPSLLEPFLLPALFFQDYFWHPFRFAPWSTPDRSNFYDRWYWFWARPRTVPVERGNEGKEARSVVQMKNILDSNGIIILFAEGGRTCFGKTFQYSAAGKRIRELKNGVGWLILKTGAIIVPVWVEDTEKILPNSPDRKKLFSFPRLGRTITIKIGETIRFAVESPYLDKDQVTNIIAGKLLELADEK